jgi:VanZ family protein
MTWFLPDWPISPISRYLNPMKKLRWIPVILYAGFIFYLSSRPWPSPVALPVGADKAIHFSMYFFLGFGLIWAFRATRFKMSHHLVWFVAIVGLCYGILDEVHQSFVPGREASVFDALADGIGSVVGAWVGVLCARMLRGEQAYKRASRRSKS